MSLSPSEELELLALLEAEAQYEAGRKLWRYFPDDGPYRRALYSKHLAFFAAGAHYPMRLMLKGNRVGGTEGFGCELAYHLTGDYPPWWEGKRFDHPIVAWAAGDTNPKTQEIIQAKLFGNKDARLTSQLGTGILPRASLAGPPTMRPGVPGAIDSARIRHRTGGESTLTLKSFEQGVESFQGNEVHVIWLDELAPLSVLTECVVRTTATSWFEGGLLAWTVTPEEGLTDGIMEFLPDGQIPQEDQAPPKYVIAITWDDVPHLSEAAKVQLRAGIPPYQLDARSRGIPVLGSGVIYPVPEDDYLVQDFAIPKHWPRAYGLDVGWKRTAALWGAWDPEADVLYLYNEHYRGEAEPTIHADAIRARGAWIRGVIDPAARGRSQVDGEQLLRIYREKGLVLAEADNAVEAGIYEVWERLSTGRLKVFQSLSHWRKEMRLYSRDKKGHVIKQDDHLCDAMRYLCLSGRAVAKAVPVATVADAENESSYGGRRRTLAWMG